MRLDQIDSNFIMETLDDSDVTWLNARDNVFTLKGGFYSEEESRYRRIPAEVTRNTTEKLEYLATTTAGMKLEFKTDSPFIAVRAVLPSVRLPMNLTSMMVYGFNLFVGDDYMSSLIPEYVRFPGNDEISFISFEAKKNINLRPSDEMTLHFPMLNGVISLEIGIKRGSKILPTERVRTKPLCFYGSSITHGCCASQPGNHYTTLLSKALRRDLLNFGFAGNARGEQPIIDYIANIDAEAFILEYDFNATVERLRESHIEIYKTIRKIHPKTPIVMFSRAAFEYYPESAERREIVRATYIYAKSLGDESVEFIDGETFYGNEDRYVCTQDTCHPNDIGFYRMYKTILERLKKYIKD